MEIKLSPEMVATLHSLSEPGCPKCDMKSDI
jgi:hypothetical protein